MIMAVFLQFINTLHVDRFTRTAILIEGLEKNRPIAGHSYLVLFYLLGVCIFAIISDGMWHSSSTLGAHTKSPAFRSTSRF